MVLAGLAALVGATLQSATSFGFALVLAPALFAAVEPGEAVSTILVLAAALNLLMLFGERRSPRVDRAQLGLLVGAAVPGMIAGALILGALSKPLLQVIAGAAIVAAALAQARREIRLQAAQSPRADGSRGAVSRAGRGGGAVAGCASGLLATTTTTNGPPLVLYFQRVGALPAQMRDSITAAFLAINVLGALVVGVLAGGGAAPDPTVLATLLALTAVGQRAGRAAFGRLEPSHFRRAGLVVVVAAGAASIGAGAAAI